MKRTLTKLSMAVFLLGSAALCAQAPTPELLHYRFDGTGTSIPNLASTPPAGTTTATIVGGLTQGPTGQCGGALIGNGQTSTSNYVNTNWTTNLTGTSWTLSFWTSNVPSTTSTYYILGDVNAGGFRVFTGGVAGAGNWILRGGFTDVLAPGGASTGPSLTTFVYDMSNNEIRAYVNGTLVSTVAQTAVNVTGPGPFKVGGYSSSACLPPGSLMDEFRLYNRTLTVAEIQSLLISNTSSTISPVSCNFVYTAPSGETMTNAGTYMDTIPNLNGCDSVITINLTFSVPPGSTMSASSCDTYTAPSGAVFTSSGTYMDTVQTALGCDSVVTINLTINASTAGNLTATACNMYVAPSGTMYMSSGIYMDTIPNVIGCDSLITINLTINSSSGSSVTATACDSYTSPSGNVYTASGTYYDTLSNAVGCDSIITTALQVNLSTTASVIANECTDYTAPSGAVYTASGIYTDIIPNMGGCDSVITINLSINQTYAIISPMACDSFITPSGAVHFNSGSFLDTIPNMAGCDSIITISLTVGNTSSATVTASSCNMYVAPSGAVYTVSGTYNDLIPNASGCDSLITINLTIVPVNVGTTQNGPALSASASGATYQWVTCPAMTPIAGATSQNFTATANGNYAVIVTENSCTDTSACLAVTDVSVAENNFSNQLQVYPNPSQGDFFVDLGATYTDVNIVITDITGRVVYSQSVNSGNIVPVALNEPAGMYIMTVTAESNTAVIRLVKE